MTSTDPTAADQPPPDERERLAADLEEGRKQVREMRVQLLALKKQLEAADRQNSILLALCVATIRLHSAQRYVDLIKNINEILVNLLGAAAFGIYLLDKRENKLPLITSEGFVGQDAASCAESAAMTVASGQLNLNPPGSLLPQTDPVACVPLKIGAETLGAIVILRMLKQKREFKPQDYEIFQLLGDNASTAIYSAKLYEIAESEVKRGARNEIVDLMPPRVYPYRASRSPKSPSKPD